MRDTAYLGIFVGGASRRMGGHPKGLLPAPDTGEPLLVRLLRVAEQAGLAPLVVGDARPYAGWLRDVPQLEDEPSGIGPLGGLVSLLSHAGETPCVSVACDMPFVSAELLCQLATWPSEAAIVAPRDALTGRWQPMFARFGPPAVLPALHEALRAGERSFQALFARLHVEAWPLDPGRAAELRDWDRPEDMDV